jgi:hypothetical protein
MKDASARLARACAPWAAYSAFAFACTFYLNARADLVSKWSEAYTASEGQPYVLMQIRAFLHGRLAVVPHPSGIGNDYDWGRGGMHQAWGLGVPILGTPLHLLGRFFGAPGFPDHVRFLVFYAIACFVLARALHRAYGQPNALIPSIAAAGFVMAFPTYVGMVSSRFLIYEQTIAVGVLWDVGLLAGLLLLLAECTPRRLAVVCAAAGFSTLIRPPLGTYGGVTVVLALVVAARKGLSRRALLAGVVAYGATTGLYLLGNDLRFGSPFSPGYENGVSGVLVDRLARWGLPFAKVPFVDAAKEMFATLFLLDPVPQQVIGVPVEAVRPYAVGERYREYYAPTFDRTILVLSVVALLLVVVRIARARLWRRDRPLEDEVAVLVGAWSLPPALALFVFYAKLGNIVTRYASDMVPAFAGACLSVGMFLVAGIRRRRPAAVPSVHLAIAGAVALYMAGWRGWATHLSHPSDAATVAAQVVSLDQGSVFVPGVPDRFKYNEPRGPVPVRTHLQEWGSDGSFVSGMIFAMKHNSCVTFTFRPLGATWTADDEASLEGFRATADSDRMVRCGAPRVDGDKRVVTLCDPRCPPYLLDGMRLYGVACLDEKLNPIDRLRMLQIDPAPECPR